MLAEAALTVAVAFVLAAFLALVNERLIEAFIAPLAERGGWNYLLPYVSLVTGALISLGFGLDLFGPIAADLSITMVASWAGYVLTAAVVGGGSNLLHDLWPDSA